MRQKAFRLVALWSLVASFACEAGSPPDLIVHGGTVITIDGTLVVSAFAVNDGSFVAVGEDSDVLALRGADTRVIDLQGKTVVPGFNDAHLHALLIPPSAIDIREVGSIDELVATLRRSENAGSGWIFAYGYDDTPLGRHPDRHDLDKVSSTRPVLAMHGSGHLFAVNSHALQAAGLGDETPDPKGGLFFRDDTGALTGLLSERAALEMLIVEGQASPLIDDFGSAKAGLTAFFEMALRHGITSFSDAMVPPSLAFVYWWVDPEEHGVRVSLMLDGDDLEGAETIQTLDEISSTLGYPALSNHWLRAQTVKGFHGLSLSGRTTRLHEPYHGRPDYYGLEPQRTQQELNAYLKRIHDMGFQAAIHTNGDYEIDMVLDALEYATADDDREHRHRIEHGSIVSPQILERMRKLEIVLAPHSYIYEKGPIVEQYGPKRWPLMFANASTFEYGIPNAGNSDYPIAGLSPMLRIQSLVTRTSRQGNTYGPEQRLTVEQALHAYTMGGAYATFEEDKKGSISVGKFADFVILSDDPRSVPPLEIRKIEVEATFVAGVERYRRAL